MASSSSARNVPTGPTVVPTVSPSELPPKGMRVQGRYRIVDELGTGAFGTVCRAEDEATGHQAAIRLLPRGLRDGPSPAPARARKQGALVTTSTAHPALVAVLELGATEDGRDFAAMELVEGRRLSEILSEGPLEVAVALRVAIEIGGAVETLHSAGLIHGAIRPRNVMVGEDWRVKLMDVELSGRRGEKTLKGAVGAEPPQEYLSLEEIRRGPVSEETDVYAFGVLLYEMLCGVPPFQAKTREALLKKQLSETPGSLRRRRRAVPASVDSMVASMLSKRPERRPAIQNVLNCLWQEANRPPNRWKRTSAIAAGVVLAASIPVLVGWGLFVPGARTHVPYVQPGNVQSAPAAAPAPVPVSAAPSPTKVDPVPAAARPVRAAVPPAAAPPVAAPAAAATPAPRPPKAERREQPAAAAKTPGAPARESSAASSSSDDPDPGAVVDWLLERAAARRGK